MVLSEQRAHSARPTDPQVLGWQAAPIEETLSDALAWCADDANARRTEAMALSSSSSSSSSSSGSSSASSDSELSDVALPRAARRPEVEASHSHLVARQRCARSDATAAVRVTAAAHPGAAAPSLLAVPPSWGGFQFRFQRDTDVHEELGVPSASTAVPKLASSRDAQGSSFPPAPGARSRSRSRSRSGDRKVSYRGGT